MKEVVWDFSARKTVRAFPVEVKKEIGVLLLTLQRGTLLGMPQSRKIQALHPSAFELRIKDANGIYRVFYAFFDGDKILVPHAFAKKTQKTPQKEMEKAKQRLRRMIYENQSTRQKNGKRP